MATKKSDFKIDLSGLPKNWTMDDIEKRMPPSVRRRKNVYRLTFQPYPYVGQYDPTFVAEFFFHINMSQKDALKARFKKLVEDKQVLSFDINSVTSCPASFAESLEKSIRRVRSGKKA